MASMSGPGSDSHDDGQSVAAAWQAPLNSIILFLTAMDMRTEEGDKPLVLHFKL